MPSQLNRSTILSALLLFAGFACAGPPPGPPFQWAPPPPEHRGRVYVYRVDSRTSLASVRATIDGKDIGMFRDREYETFEIAAGSHRLRVRMRGVGFFNLGWNEHDFRVRPGEVVFLHLQIRLQSGSDSPLEPSRDLEIAGRSDNRISENIYIAEASRPQATQDLEITRLLGTAD